MQISTAALTSRLQQSLRDFVDNEEFSDVQFIVEGRVVYGHKVILSLLSERFRAMFSRGFREATEKEIRFPDIRYPVFVRMLEYLYTGVSPHFNVELIGRGSSPGPSSSSSAGAGGNGEDSAMYTKGGGQQGADETDFNLVIDLMQLADQFMLDHLKQVCESILQSAITTDTVEYILAHASATNCEQLAALCRHYARNNHIRLGLAGHYGEGGGRR